MEKFRYEELLNEVGDSCYAENLGDSSLAYNRVIRTQVGDIVEDLGEGIYRVVSYSEGTQTANAVRATRPETVRRLGKEVNLARLIRDENLWINGEINDQEFNEFCEMRGE